MPKADNRRPSNVIMLALYYLLICLIPSLLILWGSGRYEPLASLGNWTGALRLLLFFLVLPVTDVYLLVSIKTYFPRQFNKAALFFVPYVLNLIGYALTLGLAEGFWKLWLVQSIPLFIGYLTCLLIGFGLLVLSELRQAPNTTWQETLVAVVLFSLFLLPYLYIIALGFGLTLHEYQETQPQIATFGFLCSVIMVVLFHFPLLGKLYKRGEL